jgi:tellurite resistance protein
MLRLEFWQEADVSQNDGITDDVRKREEEYFRRKDRELIEKMRHASAAAEARKALEAETGIHEPDMLRDLEDLGFTPDTIPLLPLIPVLQVAWAEKGVSAQERKAIIELARARGIADGSVADHQLHTWLDQRPSDATFRKAMRLIGAMVEHTEEGHMHLTAEELLRFCEKIAHASGGLFGIGSVSPEEQAAMQQIAAAIKAR